MSSTVRAVVRRVPVPVALGYIGILAVTSTLLGVLDPATRAAVIDGASTNLDNLSRGRIDTLVTSVFVVDNRSTWLWLPLFGALLIVGELALGARRLLLTLVVGNLVATAVVAIGLAIAVLGRWAPEEVSHAPDVGVSYGAVALVGALTAAAPRPWRGAWIGLWLAAAASSLVSESTFTAWGHVVALGTGFGLAVVYARRVAGWRRSWLPDVLLVVGCGYPAAVFGLLSPGLFVVLAAAGLGALLDRRWRGQPSPG
ncbi:rhomboid-like protein [Skermania piniformis]|uniref:Rhomboid family intramembrane serine protease n=1 Tax=Skermania pinensis TaxID=39122 RepID=A0ABX8S7Y9_9ACTN|nr:rhomboid-like protein [Skermania piniformis]QXQ13983.1 hypothetical protein KV203_00465 [Skermania piniformis]